MSFGNSQLNHHHGKHDYRHWDTSDSYPQQYQVSESIEVIPHERHIAVTDHHLYPKVHDHENYNNMNEYEGQRVHVVDHTPERVRVTEYYEYAPQQPVIIKPNHYHHDDPRTVHQENVDREADEFIRAEHKMFGLNKLKTMITNGGRGRPYK